MLVDFQTKNYPTITFFGDIAVTLLRLMGKSGNIPGAMTAAEVPAALARLQTGLADSEWVDGSAPPDDVDEPGVELATRGFPLVDLLASAVENCNDVMWKKH